MPFTVQVVLPDELINEIDDHIRRIARLHGAAPTRSALLRHWLMSAAPQMRFALQRAEERAAQDEQVLWDAQPTPRTSKTTAKTPKTPKKPTRRR